jgi:hypothetical protein
MKTKLMGLLRGADILYQFAQSASIANGSMAARKTIVDN